MDTSTINKSYRDWRAAVDERLLEIYRITISDAGIEDERLIGHWRSNEPPFEFVDWFGNKHDLTSAWDVGLRNIDY